MKILITMMAWVIITFLFSLKDKTAKEVRVRFAFMMLCGLILNYFINVR